MTPDDIERVLKRLPAGDGRRFIDARIRVAFAVGKDAGIAEALAAQPDGNLKLQADMVLDQSFIRTTSHDKRPATTLELQTINWLGEERAPLHKLTVHVFGIDLREHLTKHVRVTLEFYTPEKEPG